MAREHPGAGPFADGEPELRFVDQRMFGGLSLSDGGAELPAEMAQSPATRSTLRSTCRGAPGCGPKRTGIKRALLDQKLVSGIGNIYADEALWLARLHYARPTETMPARINGC